MEEACELGRAKIPQTRRIARDPLFRRVVGVDSPFRTKPDATIPNGEGHAIRSPEIRMMTGGTTDTTVA